MTTTEQSDELGRSPAARRSVLTLLLHKPFGVLSQFTRESGSRWGCLADWVDVPNVYAASRLDADNGAFDPH